MRLLITGATGFIGSHLVKHILVREPEIEPWLLVRESYGMGTPLPHGLEQFRGRLPRVYADLRNRSLTNRAVAEAAPDHIIHLAAVGANAPFLDVQIALRHNLTGTLNLLHAAFERSFTTQKLLVARTSGEETALNVYAASKGAAWQFCQMYARTHQWPIFGGMIYQAYGADQADTSLVPAAIKAALAGQNFPMTAGEQVKDWIHVSDVVSGLLALLHTPLELGESCDLGTGTGTAVADVVRQIYTISQSQGRPLIGRLPSRPGETPTQIANVRKTQQLCGWTAQTSLQAGLRRLIRQMNA